MFYQTQTARQPPKVPVIVHSRHPSPPAATKWCRLLLHRICSVRCTPCSALSMGMTQQLISFFCPWWPWPLTFDLDIQTRPCEFGAYPFSGSLDIFVTNKMKKSQTALKNRTLLVCGKNNHYYAE